MLRNGHTQGSHRNNNEQYSWLNEIANLMNVINMENKVVLFYTTSDRVQNSSTVVIFIRSNWIGISSILAYYWGLTGLCPLASNVFCNFTILSLSNKFTSTPTVDVPATATREWQKFSVGSGGRFVTVPYCIHRVPCTPLQQRS